jgi:hypothetical protein
VTRIGWRDGAQPYLASFNEVPRSAAPVPDRR